MNYIFLVAGKGTRMQPLTTNYPKTLFKLDKNTTILSKMIEVIKNYDKDANVIVVTGFMHEMIEEAVPDATFVYNPFFAVTNSIASLWFAKQYLKGDCVIFNGDVIVSEDMIRNIIIKHPIRPEVLLDASIKNDGDYNVEVIDDRVVVMSKGLSTYYGEFVGITRLDAPSVDALRDEVDIMIRSGQYDQWYEDALIQMIFERDFKLYYQDVSDYKWTEVDSVNDLLLARTIYRNSVSC